jgi:hypothetical protein
MEREHDKKVDELKELLDRGEYAIDPSAVADAILRRSRDQALLRAECRAVPTEDNRTQRLDQSECSYPESGPVASVNSTPGRMPAPGTVTRPIQAIRDALASAASIAVRAPGGAQTQSS